MRAQTQRVVAVRTSPGRTTGCGNAPGAGCTTCLASLSSGPVPPAATRTGPAPQSQSHRFCPCDTLPRPGAGGILSLPDQRWFLDSDDSQPSRSSESSDSPASHSVAASHSSHRLLTQALIVLKISEAPAEELCTARHFDRIALQRRPSHARSAGFLHAASSGGCIALCAGVVLLALSLIAPSPRRAAYAPPLALQSGDRTRAHMRRFAVVEASGATVPPTASSDMHCIYALHTAQDLQTHAPAPGHAQSPPL